MTIAEQLLQAEEKLAELIRPALQQWERETGLFLTEVQMLKRDGLGNIDGISVIFVDREPS